MKITEEQAIEQLRTLVETLRPLPVEWAPFDNASDDYELLAWVNASGNEWCSGKKYDFRLFNEGKEYEVGDYARSILLILGLRVG